MNLDECFVVLINPKLEKVAVKEALDGLSKTFLLLYLTFFLLEQKEPKIQDKPDPSGRFVGPSRTWAQTCRFDWHGVRKIAAKRSINKNCWLQERELCKVCTQERRAECRPEAIPHS